MGLIFCDRRMEPLTFCELAERINASVRQCELRLKREFLETARRTEAKIDLSFRKECSGPSCQYVLSALATFTIAMIALQGPMIGLVGGATIMFVALDSFWPLACWSPDSHRCRRGSRPVASTGRCLSDTRALPLPVYRPSARLSVFRPRLPRRRWLRPWGRVHAAFGTGPGGHRLISG